LKDISADLDKLQVRIKELKATKESSESTIVVDPLGLDRLESKKRNLFQHGGNKASLHFLPVIKQVNGDVGPFHAQFDRMISLPKSDVGCYEKGVYASLSNEFVPSLIERLGGYFSRIGTPDYSHAE
jgi:hypothetical protein